MDPTFVRELKGKYDQIFGGFDQELRRVPRFVDTPRLSNRMAVGPNQLTPTQEFLLRKTMRGVAAGLSGLILIGVALRINHSLGKGLVGGLGVCSLGGGIAYALIGRSQYLDLDNPDVVQSLRRMAGFEPFSVLVDHMDQHHYVFRDPAGKLQTEVFSPGHLYRYRILQDQPNAWLIGQLTDAYVRARHQYDKDAEHIGVMYNWATAKDRLERERVKGEAARHRGRAAVIEGERSWKKQQDDRNFEHRWENGGALGKTGAVLAHGYNSYHTHEMGLAAAANRDVARGLEEAADDLYERRVAPKKQKHDEAQHYLSELMRLYIRPYVNGAFNSLQTNQPDTSIRRIPNLPRWAQQPTSTHIRV